MLKQPKQPKQPNQLYGYTLLELLFAITLCSLLLGIGVPSFLKYAEKTRSQVAIDQIYRTYQFARQHAVNYHETVYLCGSNNGQTCNKQWRKFLIIFSDANNNKSPDTGEIIQLAQVDLSSAHIKSRFALGKPYTVLHSNGKASFTGSMIYCPNNNAPGNSNRVTWNKVGRPYKGVDLNRDGIIEATNGTPLINFCG